MRPLERPVLRVKRTAPLANSDPKATLVQNVSIQVNQLSRNPNWEPLLSHFRSSAADDDSDCDWTKLLRTNLHRTLPFSGKRLACGGRASERGQSDAEVIRRPDDGNSDSEREQVLRDRRQRRYGKYAGDGDDQREVDKVDPVRGVTNVATDLRFAIEMRLVDAQQAEAHECGNYAMAKSSHDTDQQLRLVRRHQTCSSRPDRKGRDNQRDDDRTPWPILEGGQQISVQVERPAEQEECEERKLSGQGTGVGAINDVCRDHHRGNNEGEQYRAPATDEKAP